MNTIHPHRKALVLGSCGTLGRAITQALTAAGWQVCGAGRQPSPHWQGDWVTLDLAAADLGPWVEQLAAFDLVVNCVGIFTEARAGDFDRLHRLGPAVLAEACQLTGCRLIHLSALGSATDAPTAYWRSKAAGDGAILASGADAVIVRPSLVFSPEGASSRLFLTLASLPALLLPGAGQQLVQPLHSADLAELVCHLAEGAQQGIVNAVGPRPLRLRDYLSALALGMQWPVPRIVPIPSGLSKGLATLAGLLPGSLLNRDSLRMLDSGHSADPAPVVQWLGRPLREATSFASPDNRASAILGWSMPLFRFVMAFVWLWTAYVSWFAYPHGPSLGWLAACGIPADWQKPTLAAASLTDAVLGCLLLWRPPRWIWSLQIALVAGYSLLLTLFLPDFWFHPFGPLSKNLPILAGLLLAWAHYRRQ
ncbi:SDR family oxidoreductase [Parachitinimonas caeni]|uniref:SDR family oxidoreductase n=1 Tax=Parachitinimonas caeni TaxID=3031301 RepID=A0ABT7DVN6_9NEIS|nr:SDR family oxidoreductase [Parachitinimonas caeni]MDK2124108.1 SDR family oxidoreductase [Parachitinimonas caeni]